MMTQTQLEELLTNMTAMTKVMTQVVSELTMTPEPEVPAKGRKSPKAKKGSTKAAKGGKKATKAPKGPRLVRSATLVAFGEATGFDFSDWSLEDVLTSVRAGTLEGFEMPEGWAFGPRSEHFLANGEWPA